MNRYVFTFRLPNQKFAVREIKASSLDYVKSFVYAFEVTNDAALVCTVGPF